uniref:Delta-like protein n=1 Tax=Platynereis dumerilii TaxID=6359 RepID=A0A1C6ZZW9_PLADU|nr:DSL-like protein 1 [Platynereis dumerilii]
MRSLSLLLLLGVVNFHTVHGNGEVRIKFIKYENSKGEDAKGNCCDRKFGFCKNNGCDHMFSVCLDAPGKPNDITRCQYGKFQSKPIKDSDINLFGSSIADLSNPLVFNVKTAFPAEFDFKVVVFDHDKGVFSGGNDHVDTLTQRMKTQPEKSYITKHRTTLAFKASMACSAHYYGKDCSKHCPPPSATSHYKCDVTTGQKLCLPGWTGTDCQTKEKKLCDTNPCKNGGSCVEQGGAASCKCTSQFKGAHCELSAATPAPKRGPCDSLKCSNGGLCLEVSDTEAKCVCIGDFTGSKCEIPVKAPSAKPAPSKQSKPGKTDEEVEIDEYFATPAPTAPPMEAGDTDCDTLAKSGFLYRDGVYDIKPKGSSKVIKVYCDMTTEGWTVIQRRKKGILNFSKDWQSYKNGFGEVGASEDFWLGLENIYLITKQNPAKYKLKIKIKTYDGEWLIAEYSKFSIDDESHDYRLHVSGYSGTAGDALNSYSDAGRHLHNGQRFSTPDRDKDNSKGNCARKYRSGWWFNDCLEANLNGPTLEVSPFGKPSCGDSPCMSWNTLAKYKGTPILATVMMIKPN